MTTVTKEITIDQIPEGAVLFPARLEYVVHLVDRGVHRTFFVRTPDTEIRANELHEQQRADDQAGIESAYRIVNGVLERGTRKQGSTEQRWETVAKIGRDVSANVDVTSDRNVFCLRGSTQSCQST